MLRLTALPLIASFLIGHAAPAAAEEEGYSAQVKQAYAHDGRIKRVAIMPLVCPDNLDCEEIEEKFSKQLTKATATEVLPSAKVADVMRNAQITTVDFDSRFILAEALTVDAFAILQITQAALEKGETTYVKMGVSKLPQEGGSMKRVQLAVQLVAKDGKSLLDATGSANLENSVRGLTGIAERTTALVLERAIPEAE